MEIDKQNSHILSLAWLEGPGHCCERSIDTSQELPGEPVHPLIGPINHTHLLSTLRLPFLSQNSLAKQTVPFQQF